MSDEEKKDAAGTSGTGDGKDGAGNDGDLSKEPPAELRKYNRGTAQGKRGVLQEAARAGTG